MGKILTNVGNPNVINNYHLGMVYKLIPPVKPRYYWDGLWLSLRHLVMQNLMFSYGRWLKFTVALKYFWGMWLFWVPPCMSEGCVDLPSRNQLIAGQGSLPIDLGRAWCRNAQLVGLGLPMKVGHTGAYLALNMPRRKMKPAWKVPQFRCTPCKSQRGRLPTWSMPDVYRPLSFTGSFM